MQIEKKKLKHRLLSVLLFSPLILSGCSDTVKATTMDIAENTLVWANEKVGDFIDNHEYREFPWQLFLTEEDRELLNQPDIPKLAEIEFDSYPVVEAIEHANDLVEETNGFVNDFELYEQHIDDETVLGDPIADIYQSEDAANVFVEQIADMYNRDYTYPEGIDLVMLEQERIEDTHEWVLHLEWKALQDSNEFLVYPLELRLTDEYKYIDGKAKKPVNSAVYTRPLATDAVIDNTSHQTFLTVWEDFSRTFSRNSEESSGELDDSHLQSLANDGVELSTLEQMFGASRGNLENASFTGWKVHDKDADALSLYTLTIPTDHEGNTLQFEITFSRPYGEILEITPK